MITQQQLVEVLDYDSLSGVFTWKYRDLTLFSKVQEFKRWNGRYAGKVAGHIHNDHSCLQYLKIKFLGKLWSAHRLAWLYVHGSFPDEQIDHLDGNGLNNSIKNLRDASSIDNTRNAKIKVDNTSGCAGVTFVKRTGKWCARIGAGGKRKHIGFSRTMEEAVLVRLAAEKEYGYHINHGRL